MRGFKDGYQHLVDYPFLVFQLPEVDGVGLLIGQLLARWRMEQLIGNGNGIGAAKTDYRYGTLSGRSGNGYYGGAISHLRKDCSAKIVKIGSREQ